MLCVHAWCICDVAESSDGLHPRMWCQAWMARSNTSAFNDLETGSMIRILHSVHQNVAVCLWCDLFGVHFRETLGKCLKINV